MTADGDHVAGAPSPDPLTALATALHAADCGCGDWSPGDEEDPRYDTAAAQTVDLLAAAGWRHEPDTLNEVVARRTRPVMWCDDHEPFGWECGCDQAYEAVETTTIRSTRGRA